MKTCKKCNEEKVDEEFYSKDNSCKVCRRAAVKANRESKAEYYREYDRKRFANDPRVKARHDRYAKTDAGKAAASRAKKKYIEKNTIKRAVHVMTGNAIRDGRLIRKPCENCSSNSNIHAHHDDYAFPLDVRWLCAKCHMAWHKINGEGKNAI